MPLIPRNWRKLSVQEIESYYKRSCNQQNIYFQGNNEGEPLKCSYCNSKKVLYFGSIHIGGGVGSSFYLACEKCKRKGDKRYVGVPLGEPNSVKISGLGRIGNVKGSGQPSQSISA